MLDVEVVRIRPGPPSPDLGRLLGIAAEIGAKHVLVIGHDPDRDNTVARFREVCEAAAGHGLAAALEFMPFRAVATLRDALDVVRAADHPAGSILVDNHHLARSSGSPEELRAVPAGLLRYAQVCDAPASAAGDGGAEALMQDALERRVLPGEGGLPVARFLDVLPPGIPVSVEILAKSVRDRFASPLLYARAIRRAMADHGISSTERLHAAG